MATVPREHNETYNSHTTEHRNQKKGPILRSACFPIRPIFKPTCMCQFAERPRMSLHTWLHDFTFLLLIPCNRTRHPRWPLRASRCMQPNYTCSVSGVRSCRFSNLAQIGAKLFSIESHRDCSKSRTMSAIGNLSRHIRCKIPLRPTMFCPQVRSAPV